MEEVKDRLAEHAAARTVPFLIGLENTREMLAHWRQRNRDDHALSMKSTGGEVNAMEPEEMGDISVSGDSTKTENHYHQYGAQPAEAGKEAPSLARKLLPLALSAALGAAGLWAANNLDWFVRRDFEVRFYNADNELIEVPRHMEKNQ